MAYGLEQPVGNKYLSKIYIYKHDSFIAGYPVAKIKIISLIWPWQ